MPQYFIEDDTDARPFSRNPRSLRIPQIR